MPPSQEQIENLLAVLAHARLYPGMVIGILSFDAVVSFSAGLNLACHCFGLDMSKVEKEVRSERGWEAYSSLGPMFQMKNMGMPIEEITLEELTMIILIIQRSASASTRPILNTHNRIRTYYSELLSQRPDDQELQKRAQFVFEKMNSLEKDLGLYSEG